MRKEKWREEAKMVTIREKGEGGREGMRKGKVK